jgi:fumarate reductase flavoprotein subunit
VTRQLDAVIVGGGMAGLAAGTRLAELKRTAAIVEQGRGRYLCNARMSGGLFHLCFRGIMKEAESLEETILKTAPDIARPDLARAIAQDGRRLISWMQQAGVHFTKGGPEEWREWMLSPPGLRGPGVQWQGRGGDVMIDTLQKRYQALGGEFREGTRAVELIVRDGRCCGIAAECEGVRQDVHASAVVLADGGFQANPDLMRQHITRHPERLRQRGAATGRGDGILMAQAVGARLTGMDRFYGHLLSRDAMRTDSLWPYPIIDMATMAGIVVEATGARFADEGMGGVYMVNAIAALDDPLSAVAILDDAIWNGPAREFILPANPHLVSAGGTLLSAPDLESLAQVVGLPGDRLSLTVAAYNAAVDAGATERLSPPRSAKTGKPWPIRTPPFHAIPLCAGITYTMGGLVADADGRVLDGDDRPIPGLYAAGCITGGLEGGEQAGYVGGLAKSGVGGLRAAEAISAA